MLKQSATRFFGLIILLVGALLFAACSATSPATAPVAEAPAATEAPAEAPADDATAETTTETTTETASTDASTTTDGTTFAIVPEGTEARFSIYELLMGQDKTVIGATSAVEGAITVDPANPTAATISPIRIDASTLATDSSRRDGAIKRWILETNNAEYQYIVFTPKRIDGLPATVTIGEPFTFTVVGDLTIRDITKEESFEMTVTANSETELVGLGQTTVMRGDYNLTISSVPSVANVAEEVPLEIEFTAVSG